VSIFKCVCAEIFRDIFPLSLAPEQLQWQAQELGVLIHFNLETFDSNGDESLNIPRPTDFNPYLLNTDNWVQTMVDFGAQEAVLVAKVRTTKTVKVE